jgi:hypothetical protein
MMKLALEQIRSSGLRAIMQRELEQPGSTLAAMAAQSDERGASSSDATQ